MPSPLTAPSSPMAYSPSSSPSTKSLFAGSRKNLTASSSLEDIIRADTNARQRKISKSTGQTPSSTPALSFCRFIYYVFSAFADMCWLQHLRLQIQSRIANFSNSILPLRGPRAFPPTRINRRLRRDTLNLVIARMRTIGMYRHTRWGPLSSTPRSKTRRTISF